jgi:hypothetical protein
MSRSLRRLAAGVLVAGSLAVLAPQAQATVQCYKVNVGGRTYYFCV